ncbi:MAG: imidazole glycerol phosphate synthase subunit HisH [Ferrovibrio sp.]|uniref:imidazole glycerol phosphate synthase subunit HisH n=1 Tax=Ferrovibrio sp. TaxID=1917215 RepID=UPI0026075D5C|nr:imidazole glycerol phosphate synthase subunit HisH [Ferrovibrio sp.]MCW0234938.1 imidazole glycerol phosphate synthase subunit HisH [Ferrovibrio sp.]
MIGVIDYGLGNLRSVVGALGKLGASAELVATPQAVARADKLILPGVGAFGRGINNLRERGLDAVIRDRVLTAGIPILGICLGMQLLASQSSEFGQHPGLDLIPGDVTRLTSDATGERVPHVGWNTIRQIEFSRLLQGVSENAYFYHVHSFHFRPKDETAAVAECTHGHAFCTVVEKGHIFGAQFHPEKSQRQGLQVLTNYLAL